MFLAPVFSALTALATYLLTKEVTKNNTWESTGVLANVTTGNPPTTPQPRTPRRKAATPKSASKRTTPKSAGPKSVQHLSEVSDAENKVNGTPFKATRSLARTRARFRRRYLYVIVVINQESTKYF